METRLKRQRKNKWALFDVEAYLKVHKSFVAGLLIFQLLGLSNLGVTLRLDDRFIVQKKQHVL